MRSDEIRELIHMIEETEIEEIEITEWFRKVRISKRSRLTAPPQAAALPAVAAPAVAAADTKRSEAKNAPEEAEATDLIPIKSPMVGTFYSAPSPDTAPYVKVGDRVGKGTVVCIVEAMKLMNEIRSEVDGRLVKVLVQNGQPVEYGQTLFLLSQA